MIVHWNLTVSAEIKLIDTPQASIQLIYRHTMLSKHMEENTISFYVGISCANHKNMGILSEHDERSRIND